MILLHYWVRQYPVTDAAEEAEVTKHTAIDVYQWLREVCSAKLQPIQLGGAGIVVQIDESLFRHKPKVKIVGLWGTIMKFIISINAASPRKTSHLTGLGVWDD